MGTHRRLRPLSVWADFCLCLPEEDLLFTLPMISVSPTEKQKSRKKMEWGKFSLFLCATYKGRLGSQAEQVPVAPWQRRHQEKLWGRSHTNPGALSARVQVRFLGRSVPGVSPGRADPVMDVPRDTLCRPGQAFVFCQRVLQGGLLVATEELFLKSRC